MRSERASEGTEVLCRHELPLGQCNLCRLEQIGFRPKGIAAVLERVGDKTAQEAYRAIPESQAVAALAEAIEAVVRNPAVEIGSKLGGDFADERGRTRGRIVVSLDHPDLEVEKYPFLSHLCVKLVTETTGIRREIQMHEAIQAALDRSPSEFLNVPRLVGIQRTSDGRLAIVMERLSSNATSMSMQHLIESSLPRRGESRLSMHTPTRISENVGLLVLNAIQDLHRLGFVHGDVNTGNFYLTQMKRVQLEEGDLPPRPRSGPWFRRLQVLLDAKVTLIDFERASTISGIKPSDRFRDPLAVAEMEEVERLLADLTISFHTRAQYDSDEEYQEDFTAAITEVLDRQGRNAA